MSEVSQQLRFPRPLYFVACPVTSEPAATYEPLVHEPFEMGQDAAGSFDSELTPILPAVWYALHLPKTRYEVLDVPFVGIRDSLREKRPHQIFLIPADALCEHELLATMSRGSEPMLILCPDEYLEAATTATSAIGCALPPVALTTLSQASLVAHWAAMGDHWRAGWPKGASLDPAAPEWAPEVSSQGSTLSRRRLLKSLGTAATPQIPDGDDPFVEAKEVLRLRTWVEACASLEERDLRQDEAEPLLQEALTDAWRRIRVPLTLSLPGVAPKYRRLAHGVHRYRTQLQKDDAGSRATGVALPNRQAAVGGRDEDPPEVLRLMVAHNAAADDSMGAAIPFPVPDAAFVALAELENHWRAGPQAKKEERLRARLDAAMRPLWSESLIETVRSASQIDAYTNFPIGLLRMPGHTAPLAALLPIAYRPINPLTRALQLEFNPARVVDLSTGMRVLIIECISESDPVGKVSRLAWSVAVEQFTDLRHSIDVAMVAASSRVEFAAAVANHRPDVLVISAHGAYDPHGNTAALMIGPEPSLGIDLGPMPPLVILSACHSGPRGAGPVSVADLLLRAGASAVLSTLVPVGVQHNSTFMVRFLLYMAETIRGVENHVSVLDLWHRVQTNTVIVDILYGNRALAAWGHSEERGTPPIVEFMSWRSRGRLRPPHLYADAEAVLLEIAARRGEEAKVRSWLRSPGYVPESMMYTLVGDPSCIRLQSPKLVAPVPPGR